MKIRSLLLSFAVAITTTASTPVKQQFSAAEQQQISIATPGLFKSYDAFNFDFGTLRDNDYSFPLPVGKATARKNGSVEIVTKEGDAVKAMFEGTVRLSRKTPDLGNAIVIRHRNGLETVYGNNAENLVDVGAHVKAGQTIAIVGERDGKVYCDFSIMVNGGRINPTSVVNLKNHHLKRQTLLFEKNGAYVNVTALGDKSEFEETKEEMKLDELFAKSNTFKWNLEKMREEAWAYPLPGAKAFLDELRATTQVIILSDTFEEFAKPLMEKLGWPTIFCNSLEVAENGEITGYKMRCEKSKLTTVKALQSIGYDTIASGDSHNDLGMIQASKAGFLFKSTDAIKSEYPEIPAYETYDELYDAIRKVIKG